MKKYKYLFLLGFLVLFFIGCNKIDSVKSLGIPLMDSMKLEESYTTEVEGVSIEPATYIVENGKFETFLFEYEELLKESDWVTVNDLKPNGLVVEKNQKKVTFLAYEEAGVLKVDIVPTPIPKEKK